jgi:hypothetical protein
MNEIRQFKLASGEELVCEVIEWATEDCCDMVIRRAFAIHTQVSNESYRYHSLKPWMALQEGLEMYITLNSNHIISEGSPQENLLKHYHSTVNNAELTDEELSKKLQEYYDMQSEEQGDDDRSIDNILDFVKHSKKDTMH